MSDTLTVRQLITKLEGIPELAKNLVVFMEGCDCMGEAVNVDVVTNVAAGETPYVIITRS